METKGVPSASHVAGMIDAMCFQLLRGKYFNTLFTTEVPEYINHWIVMDIVFLKFAKTILTPVIVKEHIAF